MNIRTLASGQSLQNDWTSDTFSPGPSGWVTIQVQTPAADRAGDFYVDVSNVGGAEDANWVTLLSGGSPVTVAVVAAVVLNYMFDVTSGAPYLRVRWDRSGGADPGAVTVTVNFKRS